MSLNCVPSANVTFARMWYAVFIFIPATRIVTGPPPLAVPSECPRERASDSLRSTANCGVQIRFHSPLHDRCPGRKERRDVASLVHSPSETIHIADADPNAPHASSEAAQREMQPPFDMNGERNGCPMSMIRRRTRACADPFD